MAPKSLVELCLEACHRNISSLTSLGDPYFMIPREILLDLLSKINDPSQLRAIEINSPHLLSETPIFWKRLIAKDFPGESRENNYAPKNSAKWYKIYERYAMERQAAQKEAEERMRRQFQGIKEKKDSRVTQLVEQKLLPRPGGRARGAGFEKSTSQLTFGRGSRTSNALQKARRQASEYRLIRGALANPSRSNPTGSVDKAPASMVNERRVASQPTFRTSLISKPTPVDQVTSGMENAKGPPTYVSDSSDDDQDDLFDDDADQPPIKKTKADPPRSTGRPAVAQKTTPVSQATTAVKTTRRPGLLNNAPKSKSVAAKTTPPASSKIENKPRPASAKKGPSSLVNKTAADRTSGSTACKPTLTQRSSGNRDTSTASLAKTSSSTAATSKPGRAVSPVPSTTDAQLSTSASTTQSPPRAMTKKRKAVDIFMPAKKRKN